MDVKDWKNVILNKILSIFKINSTPGVKLKIGTVELIFHLFFKYLVIFRSSTLENSCFPFLFSNLFSKNKSEHFEYRSFFFAPWHQKKECAPILKAPTANSFVSTIQKYLASSRYLQQLMLRTHHDPTKFLIF